MNIIIGLGNPGKKFKKTRHNTGFIMVDKIKKSWEFPDFKFSKKFNAEISKNDIHLSSSPVYKKGYRVLATEENKDECKNITIILVKPQTFMNLSSTSIKPILNFYKLTAKDIIIIHDDIDIPLGKYKIATNSSSAGHNGVQNIIENLGTQKFRRIRIGIRKTSEEKEACLISAHDYVLEDFSEKELKIIKKISEDILKEVENFL